MPFFNLKVLVLIALTVCLSDYVNSFVIPNPEPRGDLVNCESKDNRVYKTRIYNPPREDYEQEKTVQFGVEGSNQVISCYEVTDESPNRDGVVIVDRGGIGQEFVKFWMRSGKAQELAFGVTIWVKAA